MAEDKKTIGLTDANKATLEKVVEMGGFKRDMDAAKFAFALAVSRGATPGQVEGAGTIWAAGSFDEGGELKTVISSLFEEVEFPYRALESLMNAGFVILDQEIKANPALRIEDLLREPAPAT